LLLYSNDDQKKSNNRHPSHSALELIRQLQQDPKTDWQISYIGRESNSNDINDKSIESKIIPSLGVNFYSIPCGKTDPTLLS
jgi:hypothetical protein